MTLLCGDLFDLGSDVDLFDLPDEGNLLFVTVSNDVIECVIDVPWDVLCRLMTITNNGQRAIARANNSAAVSLNASQAIARANHSAGKSR